MRYHDVLRSHRWRTLKWRRLMVAEFRCERCNTGFVGRAPKQAMRLFELHHVTYARVGREHLDDVRIVCRACHAIIHGKERKECAA